jgi:hypothetical protein
MSEEEYETLLDIKLKLDEAVKLIDIASEEVKEGVPIEVYHKILKAVGSLLKIYYRIIDESLSRNKLFRLLQGDEISMYIIRVLSRSDGLNISQITRGVKRLRGRASRRIIAQRLNKLVSMGIINEVIESKEKLYFLNFDFISKL